MEDDKVVKLLKSRSELDIKIGIEILESLSSEEIVRFFTTNGKELRDKRLFIQRACDYVILRDTDADSYLHTIQNKEHKFRYSVGAYAVVLLYKINNI